jgi:hypothetical protein
MSPWTTLPLASALNYDGGRCPATSQKLGLRKVDPFTVRSFVPCNSSKSRRPRLVLQVQSAG